MWTFSLDTLEVSSGVLFSEFIDKIIAGKKYLFIGEIQNVKNWEKLVRKLYERKEYFITLRGSSSKMLPNDISTVLRGRSVNYHLTIKRRAPSLGL